jgi:hypothetical protein
LWSTSAPGRKSAASRAPFSRGPAPSPQQQCEHQELRAELLHRVDRPAKMSDVSHSGSHLARNSDIISEQHVHDAPRPAELRAEAEIPRVPDRPRPTARTSANGSADYSRGTPRRARAARARLHRLLHAFNPVPLSERAQQKQQGGHGSREQGEQALTSSTPTRESGACALPNVAAKSSLLVYGSVFIHHICPEVPVQVASK